MFEGLDPSGPVPVRLIEESVQCPAHLVDDPDLVDHEHFSAAPALAYQYYFL